jgi:5'(3')-deoxyribonucleotidase
MPSDIDEIVLGVDLDGVCADFYRQMRVVAAEWFERPIEELVEDVTFGLPEWGLDPKQQDQYDSLHRFAVTQRDLFRKVAPVKGARSVLRRLSDEKYRIRIITNRLNIYFFHAAAVQQTIEWLDHHGIPYKDLCFMREKDQVGADIYIDDAPHNIERLRSHKHYAICFANSTNKDVAEPRAKDWKEVYELIKAWRSET